MVLLVMLQACKVYEERVFAEGDWRVTEECRETVCCDTPRSYWATRAGEVFQPEHGVGEFLEGNFGSFPEDVDFSTRAVLVAYLELCTTSGSALEVLDLRRSDAGVEGTLRFGPGPVLTSFSRPVLFIETPADWALSPVHLELRD